MALPAQNGTNTHLGSPDSLFRTTWTTSHTIGAGLTDSALVVLVGSLQINAPISATWNGVAMDIVQFANKTAIFWLLNPASGTHTIAVTWATGARWIAISAITFTNCAGIYSNSADQTGNFDNNISLDQTAVGYESLALNIVMSDATVITQAAGQTEQTNFPSGPANQVFSSTATKASGTTGSTTTMSETFNPVDPSDNWTSAVQLYSATRHFTPQVQVI